MLSVINRGSVTGSDSDGLYYKIIDGYVKDSYFGEAAGTMKLAGIPTPLRIVIEPVIKNGYTKLDITPTEG